MLFLSFEINGMSFGEPFLPPVKCERRISGRRAFFTTLKNVNAEFRASISICRSFIGLKLHFFSTHPYSIYYIYSSQGFLLDIQSHHHSTQQNVLFRSIKQILSLSQPCCKFMVRKIIRRKRPIIRMSRRTAEQRPITLKMAWSGLFVRNLACILPLVCLVPNNKV